MQSDLSRSIFCAFASVGSGLRFFFFFFKDTATTEIYTLSLHDALPICAASGAHSLRFVPRYGYRHKVMNRPRSEEHRLNSSHQKISYAVFCLKKKKNKVQSHGLELQRKRRIQTPGDDGRR